MTAPVQEGPSLECGGPVPSVPLVRDYPRRTAEPRSYITTRQRQILLLVANGNTNRAIGRALGIAEESVKSQMQLILRKLRASDRTQAATIGLRLGLLELDDIDVPAGANRGYRDEALARGVRS